MGVVPFRYIPSNLVVPGSYTEFDNSQANPTSSNLRALLIGGMLAGGTAAPNMPSQILGPSDAAAQFGAGSVLADMLTNGYNPTDTFGEVWGLPLTESGTAATGSILFTGPATAAGALSLYIGGDLITVPVTAGMTAAQIATATVAAIAAQTTYIVTAAVDGGTTAKVDLTAKSASLASNDIQVAFNILGSSNGQAFPTGVGATVTAMSGGVTNPTLTAALNNLSDLPFEFIACAYTDATSLTAIEAFLGDQSGRWSWDIQLHGHCIIATRGSQSTVATVAAGINNQHITCIGFNGSPTVSWRWAAALAAAMAISVRANPAAPIRGYTLVGILPPPGPSVFLTWQRNALLLDGITTFTVDKSGAVIVEKVVTTYTVNAAGNPDQSYRNAERLFLLAFYSRDASAFEASNFTGKVLVADGTVTLPGSGVVSPAQIAGAKIAHYRYLAGQGLVQNAALYAAQLTVTIDPNNPGRVDMNEPVTLAEQLDVLASLIQFRIS